MMKDFLYSIYCLYSIQYSPSKALFNIFYTSMFYSNLYFLIHWLIYQVDKYFQTHRCIPKKDFV